MDKRNLVDRLMLVAGRLATQSRKSALRDWSDIELTMRQLRALGYLAQTPRRMSDLATFLGSSVSATTNLVERLETKALVTRRHDPTDRRVVTCQLTAEGQALIERFWRMQQRQLEVVAGILSDAELGRVVEAMELMAAALEREAGEPLGAPTPSAAVVAR